MTKHEFAAVMGYVAAAVGKETTRPLLVVYYDLLGDLDADLFMAAAKAALLSSEYPTIPTAGALRQQAVRLMAGPEITAIEAWEQVLKVLNAPSVVRERLRAELHPRARRAAECIGWSEIGQSTNGSVIRAQYKQAFESLAERDGRERLLPIAAREVVEGTVKLIEGAFRMPAALPAPRPEQGRVFSE